MSVKYTKSLEFLYAHTCTLIDAKKCYRFFVVVTSTCTIGLFIHVLIGIPKINILFYLVLECLCKTKPVERNRVNQCSHCG